jgi:predicted unusual protein kinase regulating ubiquinone biosynthesis (AarF/ABC1/UbiB family)
MAREPNVVRRAGGGRPLHLNAMGILIKPEHLRRYGEIARLLVKHGRMDLVRNAGLENALDPRNRAVPEAPPPEAMELATDLERLGPTYVKLGQLLSTRADLLPLPYLQALTRLQDRVEPFPFSEVERIVSSELGVRLDVAFAHFDPDPIAAASLGQVHRAVLRDGRPVAVKVQRPKIREQLLGDLEVLRDLANFLDKHTDVGRRYEFAGMLEELRMSLLRELDYRQEAANLSTLGENLSAFERIVIPSPIEDYTTSRVLTMDYIRGRKITALSPIPETKADAAELAEEFFHAYLRQILVDGFFHADPHPGNIFLTDDGHLAILDLGMVGKIAPRLQEYLLQLLIAVSDGRGDDAAEYALKTGEPKGGFDRPAFRRKVAELVALHHRARLEQIDVGGVVLEITRISADSGFRLPPEFTLIAKTLLNLDQVVLTLDPGFDPTASIRRHAGGILGQRVVRSVSAETVFNAVLEIKDAADRLPRRVNAILDALANNELEVKVDAIDETLLTEGLQKVANRIALSLVLAALIVGAALLMSVETPFRILGYPGLAIICFLAAAGGGVALVLEIVLHDRWRRRRQR